HMYLVGDQDQARDLLNKAARSYGHRRAAFVLALCLLQQKHLEPVGRLLDIACAGRNDAETRLLLAYYQLCQGNLEGAKAVLAALVGEGDARASYALGNLWLLYARDQDQAELSGNFYAGAADHFEKALIAR